MSAVSGVRRLGRVVYLDAADSWWWAGRTVSAREVYGADYAVPGSYRPFVLWCRVYGYPGAAWAAGCDAAKWLGCHPVRGPLTFLFLLVVAALVGLAVQG